MGDVRIPRKIKRKMISNNIGMIITGIIICIGAFILQSHFAGTATAENGSEMIIRYAFIASGILSALFLVALPVLALVTGYEFMRTREEIRKSNLSEKQISFDYDNSKPVGKIRMGELCLYNKSLYTFNIIPIAQVGLVYKQEKIKKQKKITRHRDGTIKNENYVISYRHTYNVVIKTLRGKTITINCKTNKAADDIVQAFNKYNHIIFGEGKDAQKAYREQVKAYKKMLNANSQK